MLDRFKRNRSTSTDARETGAVTTADRPPGEEREAEEDAGVRRGTVAEEDRREAAATEDPPRFRRDTTADEGRDTTLADDRARRPVTRAGAGAATAAALQTARARQRDEFGGINWGASFFGWLVAVGVAALLTGLLAAAGAAIGLTVTEEQLNSNTEELSFGGGIALLVVLMLAYYTGGYVAGRMSRFDGARQGIGTWVIGLIVTIALAAILLGTLLAALLGGKLGERYHRRIDRAGFID